MISWPWLPGQLHLLVQLQAHQSFVQATRHGGKTFEAQGLKLAEATYIIQVNCLMPAGRMLAAMYSLGPCQQIITVTAVGKEKSSGGRCTPAAVSVEMLFRLQV